MARTPKTPEEYIRLMAGQDVAGTADFSLVGNLISGYKKALESATNETVLYTNKLKQLNESSNTWQAPFMIKKSQYDTGIKGVRSYEARLNTKSSFDSKGNVKIEDTGVDFNAEIEKTEMVMLEYARKKRGNLAKKLAQQEVSEFLGTFKRTNTDTVRIGYPVEKQRWLDVLNNQFGGDVSKAKTFFGKEMDAQMSASIYKSKDLSARDRVVEKEKEAKRKEQEEKRKEKEEETSKRKMLTNVVKVLAVLGAIANICRRILSATLTRAHDLKQEAVTANALGIGYNAYRQYNTTETAMGLPKGILTGAMGTIQSKFGDITNLDNKAIEQLARVMGGQVREMIELGIGKENPSLLMEAIIDAYFKRGQSGVNSVGMYVGKERAERELATALENAGLKELATVLRNMSYLKDSGLYSFNNFAEYNKIAKAYTNGLTNADYIHAQELGTSIDILKSRFDDLSNNLKTGLLLALENVIKKINNLNIGKSAKEIADDINENKRLNRIKANEMARKIGGINKAVSDDFTNAGIDISKTGYSDWDALDEARLKNPYELIDNEEYRKIKAYFLTPKGQQTLTLLRMREIAKQKYEQAIALAEDMSGKKVPYNPSDYTTSAFQLDLTRAESWTGKGSTVMSRWYGDVMGYTSAITSEDIFNEFIRVYKDGKESLFTYEDAVKSKSYGNLNKELMNLLGKDTIKDIKKALKNDSIKATDDNIIRYAIANSMGISDETVREIMRSHMNTSGYGFSSNTWAVAFKSVKEQYKNYWQEWLGASESVMDSEAVQKYMQENYGRIEGLRLSGYNPETKSGTVTFLLTEKKEDGTQKTYSQNVDVQALLSENRTYDLDALIH